VNAKTTELFTVQRQLQWHIKQAQVWPPGSADTVCPRLPLMTQVKYFVSLIKNRRDKTYRRRCDVVTLTFDLETGAQCSTCRGVSSCQFWWYYDYSLSIYGLLGVGARQWPRQHVIAIDRSASSNFFCFDCRNWHITVFPQHNNDNDFRKFGSGTMLRSIIRILRASSVQIDTEMAEKYANQRYAVRIGRYAAGCV